MDSDRRTPPRMRVLREGMGAWEATTKALKLRQSGRYTHVLTAWDSKTDTWKVCVSS